MRILIIIASLLASAGAFAQGGIRTTKLTENTIPKPAMYKGKMINAVRWKDKQGDNIVITTETGTFPTKNSENGDGHDAELYAHRYIMDGTSANEMWRVYDFVKDCPLDIQVAFIRNSFQVTDLDKDGTAEVWIMYKTACHGDVSPCDMKIIMYEGDQKYAVRGENKVKISATESFGGEYKMDQAFLNGPKTFRDFAKKLWQKNIMEEWYNG